MDEIEPGIKQEPSPLARLKYEVDESILLNKCENLDPLDFFHILESRKSGRICSKLTIQELGKLFFYSCRVKSSVRNEIGLEIQERNVPSAGALHSIDCFVSKLDSPDWYVYNSYKHSMDRLKLCHTRSIETHKKECFSILPEMQSGYLIWYVCDIGRMESKYVNPESLAFRDSGVLSGTHNLLATALGLPFCIAGRLGYQEAADLSDERHLIGVGTAIVGGERI
ncbi:hypothetical protein [Teredinibacter turnerae]|uniref:hypothetical protein n=1 Tax=Teredinibacter turnerae TaxID=2426 RepID=UPI0012FA92FA|nr:hypothetical protein [Teredinibacter turnerae]